MAEEAFPREKDFSLSKWEEPSLRQRGYSLSKDQMLIVLLRITILLARERYKCGAQE